MFGGSSRWNRESGRRGFQGGCRHGMEWPELAGIWAKLAGIWPAAGLEEGGGRRDEAKWGSAARLGFGIRFCSVGGELGLGFRPLDENLLDGSDMLRWSDPRVVWICPLIG
jgi:hypothetical protein